MNPECLPITLTRPTPFGRRARLGLRGLDRLGGPGERGLEAEALVDVGDVVVDRLRHADDRQLACPAGPPRRRSSPRRAACRRRRSRTAAERRAARSVATITAGSWLPREVPRMVPPRLWMSATTSWVSRTGSLSPTRPRKPSRKPSTSVDAVVVRELEHQAADHVVEPGAEAAAGHDRRPGDRPGRSRCTRAGRLARARAGRRPRTAAPPRRPTVSSSSTRSDSCT